MIRETGVFRETVISLKAVDKIVWRCFPAGGSVVLFRDAHKFVIELGKFKFGDRRKLVVVLSRSLSGGNLQVGQQKFNKLYSYARGDGVSINRRLNPWWLAGLGLISFLGLSWHWLGILIGWEGVDMLLRNGGWIVGVISFALGLPVAAFSLVLSFSRPDWRFVVGFYLSVIGMAVMVADLYLIADRIIP